MTCPLCSCIQPRPICLRSHSAPSFEATPTLPTSLLTSYYTVRMATPTFSSPRLDRMSPTSTPLNTSPSVKNVLLVPPTILMGVNLQVPITLPDWLRLFLLIYCFHIVLAPGLTSLSFILLSQYTLCLPSRSGTLPLMGFILTL